MVKWNFIKREMACRLATIQSHLDLRRGILMMRFMMEGMLEGEWEDVRLLPV